MWRVGIGKILVVNSTTVIPSPHLISVLEIQFFLTHLVVLGISYEYIYL
jgi:hypothetical protein